MLKTEGDWVSGPAELMTTPTLNMTDLSNSKKHVVVEAIMFEVEAAPPH